MNAIFKSIVVISVVAMALIFSSGAFAGNNKALCLPNNAGGNIVLTQAKHPTKGALIVISTTPNGNVITGYWSLVGKSTIMIVWDFGKSSVFNGKAFVPCEL